ncbi:MAG: class I SAM-dependent methyltransferase [candidate division Zixibacteria bacterium]|nr:class I SAM-dependent methyltransferase [candidate division Zixibacteria bacterium]
MANPYDNRYRDPEYWGEKPTTIAAQFVTYLPMLKEAFPDTKLRVVDVGCGDGRDALYLAQRDIEVTGVDSSSIGLARLREKAEQAGLQTLVSCIHDDLIHYRPDSDYHAILSSGALHYAPPETRSRLFEQYKAHVLTGGLFACTVIVQKPFIPPAPDAEQGVELFRSGEISMYLWDWEILWFAEEVKDCRSSGVLHKHAFNRIIARKLL